MAETINTKIYKDGNVLQTKFLCSTLVFGILFVIALSLSYILHIGA